MLFSLQNSGRLAHPLNRTLDFDNMFGNFSVTRLADRVGFAEHLLNDEIELSSYRFGSLVRTIGLPRSCGHSKHL